MPISLPEIIDAFVYYKPELKMKEIKEYVFKHRGNTFQGYKSKYSFDQTIQKNVEKRCPHREGYTGEQIFELVHTGYYRLYNYQAEKEKRVQKLEAVITKLTMSEDEDLEQLGRTLRQVNSIDRNKALVIGLKKLYDNQCQICGLKLQISTSNFYSEVHHIKPLGEPHNGKDTVANMLVVCPNCHILLDFNSIPISKNKLTLKKEHLLDDTFIKYHNDRYKLV